MMWCLISGAVYVCTKWKCSPKKDLAVNTIVCLFLCITVIVLHKYFSCGLELKTLPYILLIQILEKWIRTFKLMMTLLEPYVVPKIGTSSVGLVVVMDESLCGAPVIQRQILGDIYWTRHEYEEVSKTVQYIGHNWFHIVDNCKMIFRYWMEFENATKLSPQERPPIFI